MEPHLLEMLTNSLSSMERNENVPFECLQMINFANASSGFASAHNCKKFPESTQQIISEPSSTQRTRNTPISVAPALKYCRLVSVVVWRKMNSN